MEVVSLKTQKSSARKRKLNSLENVDYPTVVTGECYKLNKEFYEKDCEILARSLLGKILVRKLDEETIMKGRIVETECYLGGEDKASHSYNGRRTARNEAMFMCPGTAYVYMTYGMYYCMNISSRGAGAAVLLRALQPLQGMGYMARLRGPRKRPLLPHQLCNGPAKLCTSLAISKSSCNKLQLFQDGPLWLEGEEPCPVSPLPVVSSARVGISSAGPHWANQPLRFYLLHHTSVSVRDRQAEKLILDTLSVNKSIEFIK